MNHPVTVSMATIYADEKGNSIQIGSSVWSKTILRASLSSLPAECERQLYHERDVCYQKPQYNPSFIYFAAFAAAGAPWLGDLCMNNIINTSYDHVKVKKSQQHHMWQRHGNDFYKRPYDCTECPRCVYFHRGGASWDFERRGRWVQHVPAMLRTHIKSTLHNSALIPPPPTPPFPLFHQQWEDEALLTRQLPRRVREAL